MDVFQPLRFSLLIAGAATLAAAILMVPLAFVLRRPRWRHVRWGVEVLVLLPLVLPPTVVGYLILWGLGRHSWIGQGLARWFDYSLIFRPEGAILAAAVVAMPMLYLPAKAGFSGVDPEMEAIARLYGASAWQQFWWVSLPMAWRGVLSGLVLAFARALGEFGATVMVFGRQANRQTLPLMIYDCYESGDMAAARPAVTVLLVLSLVIVGWHNWYAGKRG